MGRQFLALARRATQRRLPSSRVMPASRSSRPVSSRARRAVATASRTMLRRKQKFTMAPRRPLPAVGGLPSFSKWITTRKPSKRVLAMKRVGAPNFYVTNFGSFIKNQEGFQAATDYGHANIDLLRLIKSKVPNTSAPQVTQFVLESFTSEFLMTNSSLATQYIDIYDVIRKRDTQYAAGDLAQNPTIDPHNAWKYGVSDQSAAPPDLAAYQNINSLPTDSRLFNDYFKVVKRTHIGLVAGATHRHHVVHKMNKLIDTEVLNKAYGDLAGYTTYTLVVINGQPTSVPTETDPVVTTAQTQLDIVYSIRAKYTWVSDNQISWYVTDNLSSLTGEQITQPSLGKFVTNEVV